MVHVFFRNTLTLAGVIASSLIAGATPPWATDVQVQGPAGSLVQVGTGGIGAGILVRMNGGTSTFQNRENYQGQVHHQPPSPLDPNAYRLGVNYRGRRGGGVEITRVVPGTPADFLGLVPGQVIHSVNGRVVNTNNARREIFRADTRVSLIILEGRYWYRVTALLEPTGATGAGGAGPAGVNEEFPNVKVSGVKKERIAGP